MTNWNLAAKKPTLAEFRATFASHGATDETITAAIDVAYSIYALSKRACLHLAAHIIELATAHTGEVDGGAGEVVSETIGQKKTEFQQQAMDAGEAFYTTSKYGRLFLAIKKARPSGMGMRVFG